MSRHRSTPLCRRLLRRLVDEHGCRFETPIESCWIARIDGAILANTREGMDYTTWFIGVDRDPTPDNTCRVGDPLVWHPRWNRPDQQLGYIACRIDSADPVSRLVREPFIVRATYGRLELAVSTGPDEEG